MTTLVFFLAIAAIALSILVIEGETFRLRRPIGLLTWFVSGNWPAKIGGGLMVLGVGALLRYAAIHVDVPPSLKLASGIGIAAMLGLAATMTGRGGGRRAVSLALGGSACGVAYLTSYTAFALYGFVSNSTGLALLMMTAIATGVFAVTRSALSLAILAMIGAWLAPAFAISDPGPSVTYGYYVAASTLTMLMVAARGWRPLIHLSFVFTLAGSAFFAWNASYHAPEHFHVMSPMLLLLAALHVLMPLVERIHPRAGWVSHLDLLYALALPLTAALFAADIAPTTTDLSMLLVRLGSVWLIAAAYLKLSARAGVLLHALTGATMVLVGGAIHWPTLPWDVIWLAVAVVALAMAVHSSQSRSLHGLLTAIVLVAAAIHAITSLEPRTGAIFLNAPFFEQLTAAALIVIAARLCRRVRQPLDSTLLYVGVAWGALAIVLEALRFDVVSLLLLTHWALLAIVLLVSALASRIRLSVSMASALAIAVPVSSAGAVLGASIPAAIATLFVAPLAAISLAMRYRQAQTIDADRVFAAVAAPISALIWGHYIEVSTQLSVGYLTAIVTASAGVLVLAFGAFNPARSEGWLPLVSRMFGSVFALALLLATTLHISRDPSALVAELIVMLGLVLIAARERDDVEQRLWGPVAIIGAALLLQAHMLRWFGPSGDLTVGDLAHMQWPTLVSLLWAAMGAALTLWGRRRISRSWWASGAALLIAAAVKLVVIDIGTRLHSLGDLTNILAVIAAGGVFLLVGWLAPMPPGIPAATETGATSKATNAGTTP
jgi:uncharacterized membrane protein